MPENLREIVLGILTEIGENGTYSHTAIRAALDRYQYFSKRDRAFITKVCEGTVERMIEIDYIIDCYSTVPVEKMKPVIREILRSAVYQIRFMGGIPDSAAVNEAVRLTQKHGFYNLKGFVNGVLRSIIRNEDSIPYPDREKEPIRYLSVKYSMPEWLVSSWLDEFGSFVTGKMLESCLVERPTTVRLKTDNITKKVILDSLREQNVTVKRAPYLPYAYNISDYNYLPGLKAFQNGWIFPQDVSSMLVAEAAAPKRGDYVIDVCAAPGGKSLHIAALSGPERVVRVAGRRLCPAGIGHIARSVQPIAGWAGPSQQHTHDMVCRHCRLGHHFGHHTLVSLHTFGPAPLSCILTTKHH